MADRLEDLLRACTVRLTGSRGSGAGFFIAPGIVMTSAHVAGDTEGLTVRWERDGEPTLEVALSRGVSVLASRGRSIPALEHDYPDVALLKVTGLPDHHCVGIDVGWPADGDAFQVFGYPAEGGAVHLTPARLAYRGTKGVRPTAYIDLASDTIKPGMSGSALLNLRTGAVCGIIVASRNPARPDGALAIPLSAVSAELGEALAANRAFHRCNPRWAMALDDAQIREGGWQYPGPQLRAYLAAAVRSAADHPYPGVRSTQPPLDTVYVRQQARAISDSDQRAGSSPGAADVLAWVPSNAVFDRRENCFVVAGPGGGKSSLLRTGLVHAAAACAGGQEGAVVPVRVLAADLAAPLPLPDAIAAGVKADLGAAGWDSWPPGMFAAEPLRGIKWLVLVDGLDEIADAEARRAVVAKLVDAIRGMSPCPYLFVVATRDVPGEGLPHGDGWAESPYELQPFAAGQIRDLAERWFTEFHLPDPHSATDRFTAELDGAGLSELARVPLMATILCHLFALNAGQSLPESRAGAYRDFVDLLRRRAYASTPGGLNAQIRAALDRYGSVATNAGGTLIARLSVLIDKLADARITGDTRPSLDLVYSWASAERPPNIPAPEWRSVLGELLRRSGLLVQRGSDLVFLHQTITEYLAARHVAADPRLTARAWRHMFGLRGFSPAWVFPGQDWSYRRFLAAAWADKPGFSAALVRVSRQGINTCMFIAYLAGDRMKLAPEVVTTVIARLEKDAARPSRMREIWTIDQAHVIAALALLGENRRSDALFAVYIADPSISVRGLWSVVTSKTIPLSDSQTKEILAVIATRTDRPLGQYEREWAEERRLSAARRLAQLGDSRGIESLAAQAADPEFTLQPEQPAKALAQFGDPRGIHFLTAQLAAADTQRQLAAAKTLAELGDQRGIEFLRDHGM